MVYGILEEVHRAVPLVRVDDLAQCVVGRQTAVIKQMVDAAEIITFACDRLSLVISPMSTTCGSDVQTETLQRGLRELGINFGVTRRTWELVQEADRVPTSHQKSFQSSQHQPLAMLQLRSCVGIAPSTMQGVRSRAADASRPVLPFVCLMQAGIECVKQWLVFWQNSDECVRTGVRRAWRLSLEQLRDGRRFAAP